MSTGLTTVAKPGLIANLKSSYTLNKPKYLQGAGYVGIALTAAAGIYAGIKLPKAIDKAKKEIKKEDGKCKKFWKYSKHVVPVCIPMIACSIGTGTAFRGAYLEQSRRLTLIGAAYAGAIAETQTLKKKMEEVGGKKIAEKVKKAVKDEELSKVEDPESKAKLEAQRAENIDNPNFKGHENPYWDTLLQTIHWTTKEKLVDIEYKMLRELEANGRVDLTTFYEELGYGRRDKPMPEFATDYGWTVDTVAELDWLKAQMPAAFFDPSGTTAETHDGIPCMYLEFFDKRILWDPQIMKRR